MGRDREPRALYGNVAELLTVVNGKKTTKVLMVDPPVGQPKPFFTGAVIDASQWDQDITIDHQKARNVSKYYSELGFEKTEELPDGFEAELKNISSDLPTRTAAASLFRDYFGDSGLREVANAWRRRQTELDTWIFDYKWNDNVQSRSRRREATTVFYFRSKLIQFPTFVAMPGAFIKWPEFVIRLFPVLDQPDLFPSHPKLRYTCGFYGDEHQSHRKLLTDDVLSFLENRLQPQPAVAFARPLPPGFETCRNRLAVYRTHTVVTPEGLAESLSEAEELLRLLTMATV